MICCEIQMSKRVKSERKETQIRSLIGTIWYAYSRSIQPEYCLHIKHLRTRFSLVDLYTLTSPRAILPSLSLHVNIPARNSA